MDVQHDYRITVNKPAAHFANKLREDINLNDKFLLK